MAKRIFWRSIGCQSWFYKNLKFIILFEKNNFKKSLTVLLIKEKYINYQIGSISYYC